MKRIFVLCWVVLALCVFGCEKGQEFELKFVFNDEVIEIITDKDVQALPEFSKTGYIFNGWYFEDETRLENVNQIKELKDEKYVISANLSPISYWVVFNPNCEFFEGSMPRQSLIFDDLTALNANTYSQLGYEFLGWSRSADSEQPEYTNCEQIINLSSEQDQEIELFAIWGLSDTPTQKANFFVNGVKVAQRAIIEGKLSAPKINSDYEGWVDSSGAIYDNLSEMGDVVDINLYYACMVSESGVLEWKYRFNNRVELDIPTSINGKKILSIKNECFINQDNLAAISLPNGLIDIGERAFFNCNQISEIIIPSSVESIGFNAFGGEFVEKYVDGLRVYTIESSLEFLSLNFKNLPSLNYLFGGGLDDNWYSESGLEISGKGKFNVFSYLPSTLTRVELGGNIPDYALYSGYFISEVSLKSNVGKIGEAAFALCLNLDEIVFPSGLKEISDLAFILTPLVHVVIPSSVTYIGEGAFLACTSLVDVEFKASTNCSIMTSAFYADLDGNILEIFIYVPNGSGATKPYLTYRDSAFLLPYASRIFPVSARDKQGIIMDGSTIAGTKGDRSGNLYLNSGNAIAKHAFSSMPELEYVSLPSSLVSIGAYAFYDSMNVGNISFPNSLKSIGDHAFSGSSLETLSAMTRIVLNEGFETLGLGAFLLCYNVEYIYVPSSIKHLGYLCFAMARSVQRFSIMATTIPEIGSYTNVDGTVYEIFAYIDPVNTRIAVPDGFNKAGKSYTQIYREHEAFSSYSKHIIPHTRADEYGIYSNSSIVLSLDGQNCFDLTTQSNQYWGNYVIDDGELVLTFINGDFEPISASFSETGIEFSFNNANQTLIKPQYYYDFYNMTSFNLNPDGTGIFNMYDIYIIEFRYEIEGDVFKLWFDGNNTELEEYIGEVLYLGTIDENGAISVSIMLNDWQYPYLMDYKFEPITLEEKDYSNETDVTGTYVLTIPESSATMTIVFYADKSGKIIVGTTEYAFTYTVNGAKISISAPAIAYNTVFEILPDGNIFGELFAYNGEGTGNVGFGPLVFIKQ